MEEARAEWRMGDERGNNPALVQAIANYRAALLLAARTERAARMGQDPRTI